MSIISTCMDTQIDNHIAGNSLNRELPRQKFVVGAKQLRKALCSGIVCCVYLAENADPAITEPILALCQQQGVDYKWIRSMTELGKACGIEVGASAAAAINEMGSNG